MPCFERHASLAYVVCTYNTSTQIEIEDASFHSQRSYQRSYQRSCLLMLIQHINIRTCWVGGPVSKASTERLAAAAAAVILDKSYWMCGIYGTCGRKRKIEQSVSAKSANTIIYWSIYRPHLQRVATFAAGDQATKGCIIATFGESREAQVCIVILV